MLSYYNIEVFIAKILSIKIIAIAKLARHCRQSQSFMRMEPINLLYFFCLDNLKMKEMVIIIIYGALG